jgi:hypothetical protein
MLILEVLNFRIRPSSHVSFANALGIRGIFFTEYMTIGANDEGIPSAMPINYDGLGFTERRTLVIPSTYQPN